MADGQGSPSYQVAIRAGGDGGPPVIEKSGNDLRSAELLRHERDVLARIAHPGIVELAPGGELTEPPMLTTYVAGRTTLADRPPTELPAVIAVGAQLAVILRELHAAGWAHGALDPSHCIVAPHGGIVLCSLRRATAIAGPSHPAALDDVARLAEVVAEWRGAATRGRGTTASRLDRVLARATSRTLTAEELAVALAELDGSSSGPRTARARPEQRNRRRRTAPRRRATATAATPSHGRTIAAVVARLAVAIAAVVLLARLDLPSNGSEVRVSTDLPPAIWGMVIALRWIALAAATYGAALNATTLVALLSRSERIERAAVRLGPGPLRRWATGVASVGVLGSAMASTATAPTTAAAITVVLPTSTTSSTAPTGTTTTTSTTDPPTTTAPSAPRPTIVESPGPSPVAQHTAPLVATPITPDPASTWTVRRGDHLWAIAEHTVGSRTATTSGDDVRRYWLRLVAHNRDRLADPTNPDLIFAGQVLVLPPVA